GHIEGVGEIKARIGVCCCEGHGVEIGVGNDCSQTVDDEVASDRTNLGGGTVVYIAMVNADADDQLIAVPEQLRLVGCLQRATVAVGSDRNAINLAYDAGGPSGCLAVLGAERGGGGGLGWVWRWGRRGGWLSRRRCPGTGIRGCRPRTRRSPRPRRCCRRRAAG